MSRLRPKNDDTGVVVEKKVLPRLKPPQMYKVLLHNDDYTSMDFVVAVLQTVFNHSEASATRIMLHIHHHGVGVAGVFSYEIAETKVRKVLALAKEAEYPLLCTMEPE
jgi:ATP-dependent Clp protease adaptor protein ClpS